MPAADDVALATAVTELLNDNQNSFQVKFTAERVYVPDWDAKTELADLAVCVYAEPTGAVAAPFERSRLQKVYPIGIAFAKTLKLKGIGEIDDLRLAVQQVQEFMELRQVITANSKQFQNHGWEYRISFDPDHLFRDKGTGGEVVYSGEFLSVISFPFTLEV